MGCFHFFTQLMIRRIKLAVCPLIIIMACSFQSANDMNEETIKAMFLYNFTKHFEWPSGEAEKEIVIGVYGSEKIKNALTLITKNKQNNGKSLSVKEISDTENLEDCNILFISSSVNHLINHIREKLNGKPVLIVTEEKKMPPSGVGVNIVHMEDKIRFELNETAIKNAGLKTSKHLLSLALNTK